MKIVLATGIYPPQIGGPATYCHNLASELFALGHEVTVLTYGSRVDSPKWIVESVTKLLPIVRWFTYAAKLKQVAADADVVYCFSSVSTGVPLILSGLKKPKKVLRLGGDFFWERYTDWGGKKSLRSWYEAKGVWVKLMGWLLHHFDHIVFSTEFQQQIYRRAYQELPEHSVIENALPTLGDYPLQQHSARTPFRLLFMGRFVAFKNIEELIAALQKLPDCYLTIVGEGPLDDRIRSVAHRAQVEHRLQFVAPLSGKEKFDVFASHDLLVLPSLTEISPNTALEAASVGLPVLLTEEHGLSDTLSETMCSASLETAQQIASAITAVRSNYQVHCKSQTPKQRTYAEIASETVSLFATLTAT